MFEFIIFKRKYKNYNLITQFKLIIIIVYFGIKFDFLSGIIEGML